MPLNLDQILAGAKTVAPSKRQYLAPREEPTPEPDQPWLQFTPPTPGPVQPSPALRDAFNSINSRFRQVGQDIDAAPTDSPLIPEFERLAFQVSLLQRVIEGLATGRVPPLAPAGSHPDLVRWSEWHWHQNRHLAEVELRTPTGHAFRIGPWARPKEATLSMQGYVALARSARDLGMTPEQAMDAFLASQDTAHGRLVPSVEAASLDQAAGWG